MKIKRQMEDRAVASASYQATMRLKRRRGCCALSKAATITCVGCFLLMAATWAEEQSDAMQALVDRHIALTEDLETFQGELPERLFDLPPSGTLTVDHASASLDKGAVVRSNAGGRLVAGWFQEVTRSDGKIIALPEKVEVRDKRTDVLLRSIRIGTPKEAEEAALSSWRWTPSLREEEVELRGLGERLTLRPAELEIRHRSRIEALRGHFLDAAQAAEMSGIALRAYHQVLRCDLMLRVAEETLFGDCVAALERMAAEAPGRLVLEAGHGFSTALMRFGREEVAVVYLRPWLAEFALGQCDTETRMQFLADCMSQNRLWTGYAQALLWLTSGRLKDVRERFIVTGLGALMGWELSREPLLVPAEQWVKLGYVPELWLSDRQSYALYAMQLASQAMQLWGEIRMPDIAVHGLRDRLRQEMAFMDEWTRERERARAR